MPLFSLLSLKITINSKNMTRKAKNAHSAADVNLVVSDDEFCAVVAVCVIGEKGGEEESILVLCFFLLQTYFSGFFLL